MISFMVANEFTIKNDTNILDNDIKSTVEIKKENSFTHLYELKWFLGHTLSLQYLIYVPRSSESDHR